ncbi:MAG: cation:proton antiporter [Ignavibacteria bacterium]
MEIFPLFSILIVLSAGFAYINFRILKLPDSIGLMLVSLLFSILILIIGHFYPSLIDVLSATLESIDFSELLLEGMLSFMLFAGAIHIKYEDLKSERLTIVLFSTLSVIISTFVVGFASYYLLQVFGINVNIIHALLFGALISPTDPIAVLSILKSAGVSKSLETKIAGESLFNDGVAVVVFITILKLAQPGADINAMSILFLFGQEAVGGIFLGILVGGLGYKPISHIDNYHRQKFFYSYIVMGLVLWHIIFTFRSACNGCSRCDYRKSRKRIRRLSKVTNEYIDKFWELIDGY